MPGWNRAVAGSSNPATLMNCRVTTGSCAAAARSRERCLPAARARLAASSVRAEQTGEEILDDRDALRIQPVSVVRLRHAFAVTRAGRQRVTLDDGDPVVEVGEDTGGQ